MIQEYFRATTCPTFCKMVLLCTTFQEEHNFNERNCNIYIELILFNFKFMKYKIIKLCRSEHFNEFLLWAVGG